MMIYLPQKVIFTEAEVNNTFKGRLIIMSGKIDHWAHVQCFKHHTLYFKSLDTAYGLP